MANRRWARWPAGPSTSASSPSTSATPTPATSRPGCASAHPTLDGLSRSEFLAAMYEALGQVQDAGPDESEALAASFGL